MPSSSVFRKALLFESFADLVGGSGMILAPTTFLRFLLHPTVLATPLAVQLTQWLGGIVLALNTPLLLAYPDTPRAIASRPIAYWTLAAGEVALLGVMGLQMLVPGVMEAQNVLTERAMGATWLVLGSTLAWRLYVLLVNPEMMGTVAGLNDKKAQ